MKNDRQDCFSFARLHRAGELTSAYLPTEEDEAQRYLVRAREDVIRAFRTAKQQIGAFLLRHDFIYSGKTKWAKAYFNWLATIAMRHPTQQIVFQEYIDTVTDCSNRVARLTEQIRQQSRHSRLHELIKTLQSMRGISLIVAVTLAAELGDLTHRYI